MWTPNSLANWAVVLSPRAAAKATFALNAAPKTPPLPRHPGLLLIGRSLARELHLIRLSSFWGPPHTMRTLKGRKVIECRHMTYLQILVLLSKAA